MVQLETVLADTTSLNQNFLTIPPLILKPQAQYIIKITFRNFINMPGAATYQVNTTTTSGIQTQIIQTAVFLLKNWKQNVFQAIIGFLDCSSGTIQQVDKAMHVVWSEIDASSVESVLESSTTLPTTRLVEYTMPAFTHTPSDQYNLKIVCTTPDSPTLVGSSIVDFSMDVTSLLVYIIGGNRMQAYSRDLSMNGTAKDPDVPASI